MRCQRIRSATRTVSTNILARGSRIDACTPPPGSGRPRFLTSCVLSAQSFCKSWSSSTLCCDCSSSSDFLPADVFSSFVTLWASLLNDCNSVSNALFSWRKLSISRSFSLGPFLLLGSGSAKAVVLVPVQVPALPLGVPLCLLTHLALFKLGNSPSRIYISKLTSDCF